MESAEGDERDACAAAGRKASTRGRKTPNPYAVLIRSAGSKTERGKEVLMMPASLDSSATRSDVCYLLAWDRETSFAIITKFSLLTMVSHTSTYILLSSTLLSLVVSRARKLSGFVSKRGHLLIAALANPLRVRM